MSNPLISVIMPVFNAEHYLRKSIESILNQSITSFEFLIFDDGSIDNSVSIINSYIDSRISLYKSPNNKGYLVHLNQGINIARGKYIARMDADDISFPDRFEKQVNFLEQNSQFALVGSSVIIIDTDGNETKSMNLASECLPTDLFWKNPIVHSTVMGRTEIFKKYYYSNDYYTAEDYYLWSQISLSDGIANLETPLLKYRIHKNNISVLKSVQQQACTRNIYLFHLSRLGLAHLSSEELELHNMLVHDKIDITKNNNSQILKTLLWIRRLRSCNNKLLVFDIKCFNSKLKSKWETCFQFNLSYKHGIKAIPLAWDNFNKTVKTKTKIVFIIRCIISEITNLGWSR